MIMTDVFVSSQPGLQEGEIETSESCASIWVTDVSYVCDGSVQLRIDNHAFFPQDLREAAEAFLRMAAVLEERATD